MVPVWVVCVRIGYYTLYLSAPKKELIGKANSADTKRLTCHLLLGWPLYSRTASQTWKGITGQIIL